MMKVMNTDAGPRGFWKGSDLVMVEAGGAFEGELSADDAKAAKAMGYFDVSGAKAASDKPDYERDSLKDVDLHKPATSKDVLLVIAAYEQADVPEGDDATKADLIKAIEAKRKGAN